MNRSSAAYSKEGGSARMTNTNAATTATVSRKARRGGEHIPTNAVMRMCSPRRKATTAPSIASHRNKMEASSSDQTSGRWKT